MKSLVPLHQIRKRSCQLRDVDETRFRDYCNWWWVFFLHSFSVYLEKNFLCVQMLRKHFKGFVSINSSTSNLSKATHGLWCWFIKNDLLCIQNQIYLNLNSLEFQWYLLQSPWAHWTRFKTAYCHNLPARQQSDCMFWFCSLFLRQLFSSSWLLSLAL